MTPKLIHPHHKPEYSYTPQRHTGRKEGVNWGTSDMALVLPVCIHACEICGMTRHATLQQHNLEDILSDAAADSKHVDSTALVDFLIIGPNLPRMRNYQQPKYHRKSDALFTGLRNLRMVLHTGRSKGS